MTGWIDGIKARSAWLESLKVGDEVVQVGGYLYGGGVALSKVIRMTRTQVMVGEHEARYRKTDGRRVGQGFYTVRIEPPSDEYRQMVEMHVLSTWLQATAHRNRTSSRTALSIAVLRAMKQAHDEAIKSEPNQQHGSEK